jgi:hypothetical protein
MSIFSQPKISYNKETKEIGFSWEPTKEEMLHLHNYTWEAANEGKNRERERIIKLFQHEQYRFGQDFVDEIIQIIKGEKK